MRRYGYSGWAHAGLAMTAILAVAGCGRGNVGGEKPAGVPSAVVARAEMAEIELEAEKLERVDCSKVPNVVPILDCVDKVKCDDKNDDDNHCKDGYRYVAHFGYDNETGSKASIDVGQFNRFVPGPRDRGQPTKFDQGKHDDVFHVTFNGKPLSWFLAKNKAIASSASPLCQQQSQCPPSCDDSNPCTADSCSAATNFQCVHTPVDNGTSCSDGNVCAGPQVCQQGICEKGPALDCNSHNPCMADSCDPKTGCVHTPVSDGTSCPATSACNSAGTCSAGQCQAGPGLDCNSHNPCVADSCDPKTGCVHTPVSDGTSCSDGNACDGQETCQGGQCASGMPLVCTTPNQCAAASCDPATGCVITPVKDGTPCTPTAGCGAAGQCLSGSCTATNGPNCDDGNPCTADACGPNGACVHTPVTNGTSCSDGNACNGQETCQGGQCAPGTPVVCTASDQCHAVGTCNPTTGVCSNPVATNGTKCDDGNKCDANDMCNNGVCTGTAKTCTASDQCHSAGACDPMTGVCSNPPVNDGTTCNDGNVCNGAEQCKSGTCTSVTPLDCGSHNPCVADSCDPVTGCQHTNVADGTVCAAANGCAGASVCKSGQCTATSGTSCDDGNPCTADSCGANGQCVHTAVANGTQCSDGNLCNGNETCQTGVCTSGTPVVCKAADQCHVAGTCDPHTGMCSNPAASDGTTCNDGNACDTNDVCKGGSCVGTPVVCTAADQCHVAGTCDPTSGKCSNPSAPDGTSCNDGNLCDTGDVCKAGSCVAGSTVTCKAQDQCHVVGTCDPTSGKCSNPSAPDGTACNDPNLCDQNAVCTAGACKGTPLTCTAQDQCHVAGSCDSATGKCSNPNATDGTKCNDGKLCDVSACASGTCTGTPLVCTADPGCTPGVCSPTTGMCSAQTCGPACPTASWADSFNTPLIGSVALDPTGDLLITGGLGSLPIDFGNGPLTTNGSSDLYVARINPATGKSLWSAHYGDTADQTGVAVTATSDSKVLAVTGSYVGALTLGTGLSLTSANGSVFVAGFAVADGKPMWIKDVNLGGGALLGIANDPTDNGIIVVGYVVANAQADFGGGPLGSPGSTGSQVVAAKYKSADGTLVWAKQYKGSGDATGYAVTVDGTGRVFLVGQYNGATAPALDFGNGPLPTVSTAASVIFVARLDGTGTGTVSQRFGTSGKHIAKSVVTDSSGNVFISGNIGPNRNGVDFLCGSPSTCVLKSAGGEDAYVAKLKPDLSGGLWAKRYGDATNDQDATSVAINGSGDVVVVGLFGGSMDLSPAATLTSAGGFDAWVATLAGADGAAKCASSTGDTADQTALNVAVDPSSNTEYVLGSFISSINWDGKAPLTGDPAKTQTYLVQRK